MHLGPEWKYDVEDFLAGFLELKNDVSVSFELSWASNIEKELMFYICKKRRKVSGF